MKHASVQLPLELSHSNEFYPDDLVITKSNVAAFELIEQWPKWHMPIAALVGPCGSGKTHFARVWANLSGAIELKLSEIDKAIKAAETGCPILIEDISSTSLDETALFHLINAVKQAHIVNAQASLLLTASTSLLSWHVQLNDLISRLKSMTFATLDQPDDELLTSVAFKLFADRQIIVDTHIVNFIISRSERSLFALGALVESIDRLALQRKSKITKTIILEAMQNKKQL